MAPEVEHIRAYTMACLEMLGKLQEVTAKSDFSDTDAETFPKNPSGPFLRGISQTDSSFAGCLMSPLCGDPG